MLAGFFGVGGGILFVPTLVGLGLSQLDAEATSLLAILPTVAAGTWRQRRYGNVRWRTALVLGLASIAGVAVGVQIATSLPEDTLRRLFAAAAARRRRRNSHGGRVVQPRILLNHDGARGDLAPARR